MHSMKLADIVRELEATVLLGEDGLNAEITRCGASDLMSDVLARPTEGILLLTGLTSVQTVRTSKIAGVVAIVFVRGKKPLPEVIEVAKSERMPLFTTSCGMFACCGRLHALGLTGLDGRR
jgi:predicted transcriptional regulator